MPMSAAAEKRLAELGIVFDDDLEVWRWLWDNGGEEAFWKKVSEEAKALAPYLEWFPRLQGFAAECRRTSPAPMWSELSSKEREQERILRSKMSESSSPDGSRIVRHRHGHVSILATSRPGLSAAIEIFSSPDTVVLEQAERDRWFSEIYVEDEDDAFSWYALAWWWIEEELPPEEETRILRDYPIPPGSSYWIVVSGIAWGPLHGGCDSELWQWDGQRAQFIELLDAEVY